MEQENARKMSRIGDWFEGSVSLAQSLSGDQKLKLSILEAATILSLAARRGGEILIFGNGGSAAQAQHFVAELVCRFRKDRRAIAAIALTTDTSILTAQSNDLGFHSVFARQIEAFCGPGSVAIGLTTSDVGGDHCKNIENAFLEVKKRGGRSIGLFSERTKNLLSLVDVPIIIPNSDTARIQEAHQAVIHLLCELIEEDIN